MADWWILLMDGVMEGGLVEGEGKEEGNIERNRRRKQKNR